jgi:hypothetical protein
MEELLTNFFVRYTLPSHFDSQLWRVISQESPQSFQTKQRALLQMFQRDVSLKEKLFEKFERNHLNLYGWSLLATREKAEIQPYLLKELLSQTPSFHRSKLPGALHSKFPHRHSRTEPNELRKLMNKPASN